MITSVKNFGYLPDRKDRRDRTTADLFRAVAEPTVVLSQVDWRPKVPSILDQGSIGSCAAHGALGAIRLKHVLNRAEPILGSRLLTYWGARSIIGMQASDSGCHIRDVFRFLNKVGFMPEKDTENKYDISKFRMAPTPEEQRKMFDQRSSGGRVSYFRIFETGSARKTALKRAMSQGAIPVLGTDTTKEFLKYKGGILKRPSAKLKSTGGHAFYLCGYDSECVYSPNSWGKSFGENGFMRLSWDYVMWSKTQDVWCVLDAPYYSGLKQ